MHDNPLQLVQRSAGWDSIEAGVGVRNLAAAGSLAVRIPVVVRTPELAVEGKPQETQRVGCILVARGDQQGAYMQG